jgi:hypothetical protein
MTARPHDRTTARPHDCTNKEGAAQLSKILSEYGYTTPTVEVQSGIHLKPGITYLGKSNFMQE